nr:hypothetical protein [Candidatus Sigynarchaeota archaeon]
MSIRAFTRAIGNSWWVFYGIIVIWGFLAGDPVNIPLGIMLVFIGIILGIVIYILKRRKKVSMSKNLLGINRINENELARLSGAYIEDTHAFLHDISRNPDSSGVSILVKGQYVYFSNEVVKKFKLLYKSGKNSKDILAEMPEFETREEVKKMLEKLKDFEELPDRDVQAE